MDFFPLHDRVIIRRIIPKAITAGGIHLPDNVQEKPQEGEILSVGPGGRDETGKLIPMSVKVGDHVLFGKWSGSEVKIDGTDVVILKESEIIGIFGASKNLKAA